MESVIDRHKMKARVSHIEGMKMPVTLEESVKTRKPEDDSTH